MGPVTAEPTVRLRMLCRVLNMDYMGIEKAVEMVWCIGVVRVMDSGIFTSRGRKSVTDAGSCRGRDNAQAKMLTLIPGVNTSKRGDLSNNLLLVMVIVSLPHRYLGPLRLMEVMTISLQPPELIALHISNIYGET